MATANNEKHLRCPMCEALVMIVYRGEEWPDEDECGDCGTELRFDPAEQEYTLRNAGDQEALDELTAERALGMGGKDFD